MARNNEDSSMRTVLDKVKEKLTANMGASGSLRSVRKVFQGSTQNIGRFPVIALIPLNTEYEPLYSWNNGQVAPKSDCPFGLAKYTVKIEVYSHNLKPKSAYKQGEGILNTIKNLLHQTSQKDDFDILGPRSNAIDVEITSQKFGNPSAYKRGFLQVSSLEIIYTSGYNAWSVITPGLLSGGGNDSWTDKQMKEVETTLVNQIKAFLQLDNPYLKKVKRVSDGILGNIGKFPQINITAAEEEEVRLTGINILNREFDIDVFTKKLPRQATINENIYLVEELMRNLNKNLLYDNIGLGGSFINNYISNIEYGEIQQNNVSLYASTLTLEGQSYQPRL